MNLQRLPRALAYAALVPYLCWVAMVVQLTLARWASVTPHQQMSKMAVVANQVATAACTTAKITADLVQILGPDR